MPARTLYVTDPSTLPLAKAICDVLADVHELRTKAAVLPASVNGKLLRTGVIMKVHPGGSYAPSTKNAAIKLDLVVPGGIIPYDHTVTWAHRGTLYEALVRDLAGMWAPYIDAPAKRTLGLYMYKVQTKRLAPVISMFREAGLEPLAPKESGKGAYSDEEDTWRKKAWGRLELQYPWSFEDKLWARGETTPGVYIGGSAGRSIHSFKVRRPRGEAEEVTRKRLHSLLDRELLPKLGGVPEKHRHDEAAILAFLAGASAPAKAKTTATAKAKPAAKAKAAKPAKGARRFEFTGGGSSKFWTVSTQGSTVSVTFGRIGTPGQTKAKSYASGAAAVAAMQKLVAEKTGKGYVEA